MEFKPICMIGQRTSHMQAFVVEHSIWFLSCSFDNNRFTLYYWTTRGSLSDESQETGGLLGNKDVLPIHLFHYCARFLHVVGHRP